MESVDHAGLRGSSLFIAILAPIQWAMAQFHNILAPFANGRLAPVYYYSSRMGQLVLVALEYCIEHSKLERHDITVTSSSSSTT